MTHLSNRSFPWFRLYNEVLSDRKVARICAITKQPKAVVVGLWSILLAMANQSPERGRLLISDGMPVTFEEIAFETGLDTEACHNLVDSFMAHNMLCLEGNCFVIVHWEDRQFGRDDSKERVRKYREKREALGLTVAPRYDSAVIIERDKECVYCGSTRNLCVDHIYPIEQGGTDHDDNLAAACKACSGGKVGRTPEQAGYSFVNLSAETRYKSYVNNVLNMRNSVTVTDNGDVTSVTPLESESDSDSTTAKNPIDETVILLRREVVSIWENNINVGGPGPILTDRIVDVLSDIPGNNELKIKWFREAVGRARGAGVSNWNYIKAILESWIAKGEIDDAPPPKETQTRRGPKSRGRETPQKTTLTFPPIPELPPPSLLPPHALIWQQALAFLQPYADTLAGVEARSSPNGTFILAAPDANKKAWIDGRLSNTILKALRQFKPDIQKLEVLTQ